MNAIDFAVLADVKAWLAGSATMGNADDALLASLITSSSRFLLKQMNRSTIKIETYIERFKGNGRDRLTLRNDPAVNVLSVQCGGIVVLPSDDGVLSVGYWLEDDGVTLTLIGYVFPDGDRCVVEYQAGWSAVPEDLQQACIELVGMKYRRRKRIGMMSEALPQGAGTAMYDKNDVTPTIQTVIEQYSLRF